MAKSAQAFRTIREVADWLDVAAHVLRFWESKFNQIKPVKRAGGRRYYRPADMALVGGIKVLLHDRGMTIRGVQKMISDEGVEAVSALSPPIDTLLDNPNVVQLDSADAWDMDAESDVGEDLANDAHEAAAVAETTPEPEPVAEVTPAPDPIPTAPAADQAPPATTSTAAQDAPELPITAHLADALLSDAPLPEPREDAAVAATPPDPAGNSDTAPDPAPDLTPPLPHARGSVDALTSLAGFASLPPAQRAALRPQIAALARLRDRMVSDRTGT